MKARKVMKLASRGKRLGAFCIDAFIPFIASTVILTSFTKLIVAVSNPYYRGYGSDPFSDFGSGLGGYGYGYGYNDFNTHGSVMAIVISLFILMVLSIVQLVFFTKSTTIGKAALGLQVVSDTDGEPIGFWKMLLREWFVKRASASVLLLGYFWILLDEKNRGWHDKILDTFVVDLKESEKLNRRRTRQARPAAPAAPSPAREVRDVFNETPVVASAGKGQEMEVVAEPAEKEERRAPEAAEKVAENVIEVADLIVMTAETAAAEAKSTAEEIPESEAQEEAEQPAELAAEKVQESAADETEEAAEEVSDAVEEASGLVGEITEDADEAAGETAADETEPAEETKEIVTAE